MFVSCFHGAEAPPPLLWLTLTFKFGVSTNDLVCSSQKFWACSSRLDYRHNISTFHMVEHPRRRGDGGHDVASRPVCVPPKAASGQRSFQVIPPLTAEAMNRAKAGQRHVPLGHHRGDACPMIVTAEVGQRAGLSIRPTSVPHLSTSVAGQLLTDAPSQA